MVPDPAIEDKNGMLNENGFANLLVQIRDITAGINESFPGQSYSQDAKATIAALEAATIQLLARQEVEMIETESEEFAIPELTELEDVAEVDGQSDQAAESARVSARNEQIQLINDEITQLNRCLSDYNRSIRICVPAVLEVWQAAALSPANVEAPQTADPQFLALRLKPTAPEHKPTGTLPPLLLR